MLLVDTYNVLHVTGVLPPDLAGPDAQALARLIARSRYRTKPVRLVMDGVPSGWASAGPRPRGRIRGHLGEVELIYAGRGRDADSLIESLIADDSAPRRLVVVSSDRRIRRAARRRKARALDSEGFLRQLAEDHAGWRERALPEDPNESVPLDEQQVEAWMEEFGLDASRPSPEVQELERRSARERAAETQAALSRAATLRERAGQAGAETGAKESAPELGGDAGGVAGGQAGGDEAWVREALRAFEGRLSPEDLDMRRWLGEEAP